MIKHKIEFYTPHAVPYRDTGRIAGVNTRNFHCIIPAGTICHPAEIPGQEEEIFRVSPWRGMTHDHAREQYTRGILIKGVHNITPRVVKQRTPRWSFCGLNADWSCAAWHYGTATPNASDCDLYVIDGEDGDICEGFGVVQTFPETPALANLNQDPCEEHIGPLLRWGLTLPEAMVFAESLYEKRLAAGLDTLVAFRDGGFMAYTQTGKGVAK